MNVGGKSATPLCMDVSRRSIVDVDTLSRKLKRMFPRDPVQKTRTGDNKGWRFDLSCGAVVILYETGTVLVQGKGENHTRLKRLAASWNVDLFPDVQKTVLVMGRDRQGRKQIRTVLKARGVTPISAKDLCGKDRAIERLHTRRHLFRFAIYLPARAIERGSGNELRYSRYQRNDGLRLGLVLAALGQERLAVPVGNDVTRVPSELPNEVLIRYGRNLKSAESEIFKRLKANGVPFKE